MESSSTLKAQECQSSNSCRPRKPTQTKSVWTSLLVCLLGFMGKCAAQNETLAPVSITPFPGNISTVAPSLVPPTPAPPPVVTTNNIADAWFVLLFNLESEDPNSGLWNETQTNSFVAVMEGLTQKFANSSWERVVTMCILQSQTLISSSAPETFAPSFSPNTTVSVADSNLILDSNTSQPNVQIYTYEYTLQMTYISSSVNVSQYPQRLVEYVNSNTDSFQQTLQTSINLPGQSNLQFISLQQVAQITQAPTVATMSPTSSPTVSANPSQTPSISSQPTVSSQPSSMPSFAPTGYPSSAPTMMPTNFPTFIRGNSSASDNFALDFTLQAPDGAGYLNSSQELYFCELMENQTYVFAPETADRVRTQCLFFDDTYIKRTKVVTQAPTTVTPEENRTLREIYTLRKPRDLQATYTTTTYTYTYTFRMRYSSATVNVTGYNQIFPTTIASNSIEINNKLTAMLGLTANNNLTLVSISTFEVKSEAPTQSLAPSTSPTGLPTTKVTQYPTVSLTNFPTRSPTSGPSIAPSEMPSFSPSEAPQGSDQTTIIAVVVVVAFVATVMLVGMAWFYRTRRQFQKEEAMKNSERRRRNDSSEQNQNGAYPLRKASNNSEQGQRYDHTVATSPNSYYTTGDVGTQYQNATQRILMSPSASESILSNPSLLSNGQGDDGDDDEQDDDDDEDFPQARYSTIDDFDQFKDHNLEKMRSSVQDSVAGMDGMMSQALTMAILGGPSYQLPESCDGIEMETNIVSEVNDWLKRHDFAAQDERQSFMQDILNKMVYCVRQGILTPEEASRTIHECASLLHQPLLSPLPNDTIILSGLRKTVKANDVIRAFRRFGPIDDAAVVNQRGFGLIRFRNPKATQQAMFKYRTSEIVVQDVAVQCRTFDTGER